MERFQGINLRLLGTPGEKQTLLDYGCGGGEVSVFFLRRGLSVTAADVDPECRGRVLQKLTAEEKERFQFVLIEPSRDEGPSALSGRQFDYVVCREVLEHVPDPALVLARFSELLAEGGRLVVSVPTSWSERYFSRWDSGWLEKSEHLRIFSRRQLRELLRRNGLFGVAEEGQSSRWTLFWALLAPLRVRHRMGNPQSHRLLAAAVQRGIGLLCSLPGFESAADRLIPKSRFYYAVKRKPRILVVYDYADWILGKWAAQIRRVHGQEFDIVTLSMFQATQDKASAAELVRKVDVVHLLLPHPYRLFRRLARGKALIATIHHWVAWEKMYQRAAQANWLVTGARHWQERLVEQGVPAERVTVVHSGIGEEFFREHPPLLPDSPKLTCGFFAKMDSNESDRKGSRHFLKLAEKMAGAGLAESFRLVISGPGWQAEVDRLASSGVETVYLSYVAEQEMPSLYRSLDVYLMLSDVEGGPVTIAEAMASGCLVLSTAVGVAREIVQDGVTGRMVDTADLDGILEKLVHYHGNRDELKAISAEAERFARAKMGFDRTLPPLGPLYREAASAGGRGGEGALDADRENALTVARAARVKG